MTNLTTRKGTYIEDPAFAKMLFGDTRFSFIWLVLRLYLGYEWLTAGWHKVTSPDWVQTGVALKGFWTGAIAMPEAGRPPIAFDWYRSFLTYMLNAEAYTWFAKLIAYGEVLIGIALILGLFTGIAAFFSGFMNWNFIMARTASTNGMLFYIAVLLILAWKTAGYIGVDYYLLPYLGTPWTGKRFEPNVVAAPAD